MTGVRLRRNRAALLVIDVQERLCTAMDPEALAEMRRKTAILIRGAAVLGLPVVVTEQYPKGLGPTVADLAEALPPDALRFHKSVFSCVGAPDIMAALEAEGKSQWILAGMEAHVCVFQTARDLVERGWEVFAAEDAILSRRPQDKDTAMRLIQRTGAAITCVEAALFDLLGKAGSAEFKAISAMVK